MARSAMRDVIVLLPGITGSVLQKNGKDVWAVSGGAAARALRTLGGSIQDLVLSEDPVDADDLGDGVTAPRVVHDVHLIPGLWKIDGYTKIATTVRNAFNVTPGENYFEFPYDWRRDNRVAARRLARESHRWLRAWAERSGNDGAKLILIGHSMGGLVARYFVELLEGWKSTRMLITFGTPYRGSLNALDFVVNGMRKMLGPLTLVDLSDLLRSFTSVYQLLPVYPCYDPGDGQLLRVTEAPLPRLDTARAQSALAFHHEVRDAIQAHQDDPDYQRSRYRLQPIVGIFQPTLQSARRAGDRIELLRSYRGEDQNGDGTVPRVSAVPLDLSEAGLEVFVADRHGSLQNNDPVLVQLRGLLSGLDLDLTAYYATTARVSLDLEDAYLAGAPFELRARCEDETVELTVAVMNAETGEVAARTRLDPDEDWRRAVVGGLPAGTYRATVRGDGSVDPVTDIFAVLDEVTHPVG